jgi:glycosyltransferase involved in cell wall biosynthesis
MKILFYSDSREFGGHEYMTVAAIRFMSEQPNLQLSVIYYERNFRLHNELCEIQEGRNLTLFPLSIKSEGLPATRPLYWISRLPRLRRLIRSVAPDVVVVSQGNIEVSCLGLMAAQLAKTQKISYIPMAHGVALSSGPLAIARAIASRYLYRLPDKFITISKDARDMLTQHGVTSEIAVVPNGIELRPREDENRSTSRLTYGFRDDQYVIAVVGRIVFRQKGQDFLVNAIARYREQLRGIHVCVIGEGPDEQRLRTMIGEASLQDSISILPWKHGLASLYSAVDMVLIPSRFEGVPLVMLEAMWHQLPVAASNVDGMAEVLPKEWLFQGGDAASMVETVTRLRSTEQSELLAVNKKRVAKEFDISRFQEKFCAEVTNWLSPMPSPNVQTYVDVPKLHA